jgi:formimidoylglutamate deiminase
MTAGATVAEGGGETIWAPELLYRGGSFARGMAVVCDDRGRIARIGQLPEDLGRARALPRRAMLPGMVNAHSHSFQRAIRGRTEHRTSAERDTFWTWREAMYHAACRLSPEDIYHVARMAFAEMLLSGITTVGEFHYLHHGPDGAPYADRNLLAEQVTRAARAVGLRIALQRTAYVRAGWQVAPNPLQARFLTPLVEDFIADTEALRASFAKVYAPESAWVSVAPHSVRAVPLPYVMELESYARSRNMKVHMHVAEQPAEIAACEAEYGARPLTLLHRHGILSGRFTGVHAIHITDAEIDFLRQAQAKVCACPTTERNLGDGIGPVERLTARAVEICYGTDSNIQIDLLEDARQLEYHLRLQLLRRAVLAPDTGVDGLAARLFEHATRAGAESVGASAGVLQAGALADFFTVDLDDPSIAGAGVESLLSNILFSAERSAIAEVFVGGQQIIESGRHPLQPEIVARFGEVQRNLWGDS